MSASHSDPDTTRGQLDGRQDPELLRYMPPRVAHEFTHRLEAWLQYRGYESFDIEVAPSGMLTRIELSTTGVDQEGTAREEFEAAIRETRISVRVDD